MKRLGSTCVPLALVGGPLLGDDFALPELVASAGGRLVLDASEWGERTLPAPLRREELVRDVLVDLGLQEVVTYRMTSAGREARRVPDDLIGTKPFFRLTNPITPERNVLRQSLLASVLEVIERNARRRANTFASRLAFFEIGPVFFHSEAGADHDLSSPHPDDLPLLPLPDELPRLAIALTGLRQPVTWEVADMGLMNF